MNKRSFLKVLVGAAVVPTVAVSAYQTLLADRNTSSTTDVTVTLTEDKQVEKIELSRAEWKKKLTPAQYRVLRKAGTERPYSSPLNNEKRDGVFACAGCELPLFESETKFESGTGWPSFFQPLSGHVATSTDFKLIFPRTEYHCARCGGHQGHVFKDGPRPTGLRYCNNGVALTFVPA